MIHLLCEKLDLPQTCYLGKRIHKKLFHENAKLGATDKKTLREDIEAITWDYTLKPSTIPIKPFVDEEHEYVEVAIIRVTLRSRKRTDRIAEIIHRAIPYPVVLVLAGNSSVRMSLATKRFSQAERGAIVADEFFATDWIDLAAPSPIEESFLGSLTATALPHTDLRAFYHALVDRVVALSCATRTGSFVLETGGIRPEERRDALAACRDLESRIAEERTALKKEQQFNRQVDHNVRIKQMEKELEQKLAAL